MSLLSTNSNNGNNHAGDEENGDKETETRYLFNIYNLRLILY